MGSGPVFTMLSPKKSIEMSNILATVAAIDDNRDAGDL